MTTTNDTKWNPGLYDDRHNFVFKFGEDVVRLLDPRPGEHILDLGCGTGYLTNLISRAGARVIGIDASAAMIERAQAAYPDLDFRCLSATEFQLDAPVDAIFSNAVLHWVLDKQAAIDRMYHALRPGGRLVLEMGGKGNVDEVLVAVRKALTRHGYYANAATQVWYFPSLAEYTTLLERGGFHIRFATHFDRPTELQDAGSGIRDWLRMFCNALFRDIPDNRLEPLLEEIQEALRPARYQHNAWIADYKRLRIEAFRQL